MAGNPTGQPIQRAFLYHADANPVGGTINGNNIPSYASVSLPLAGGELKRRRTAPKEIMDDLVSYTSVSTHVIGRTQGDAWTTLVTATIKDLSILKVVTAKTVVAQLEVSHPQNGGEPIISVFGSQFEGLKISGVEIKPDIRYDLFSEHDGSSQKPAQKYPTKSWLEQAKFLEKVKSQRDNHEKTYAGLSSSVQQHFYKFAPAPVQNNDKYLVCSLIDELPVPQKLGVTLCGNGIYIPGYGKFFFGELIVQHKTFTVSMVRAELGSANVGPVSAASVRSNGVPSGP
ncbi:MAG: choice-of-anchor P family protein [Alloacidobacterium sp.]|jgi:hypothetical protein